MCDDTGALLVIDEVQSGIGRTGQWFASQAEGVRADVITLAKGLGGGLPIGVCIGVGAAGELFQPGLHGSTFGGNPVSAAAALAVLDTIEKDDLLTSVREVGAHLAPALAAIDSPLVQRRPRHRAVAGRRPDRSRWPPRSKLRPGPAACSSTRSSPTSCAWPRR